MSVEEVYELTIKSLPEHEQMRLASLIMWKCAKNGSLNYSEEWVGRGYAGGDCGERRALRTARGRGRNRIACPNRRILLCAIRHGATSIAGAIGPLGDGLVESGGSG